jgi:hypothetical protein
MSSKSTGYHAKQKLLHITDRKKWEWFTSIKKNCLVQQKLFFPVHQTSAIAL